MSDREYAGYDFVLRYRGNRYVSLMKLTSAEHARWHKHFDGTVDPVMVNDKAFYRTKEGALVSLTPTNMMVALGPRAYDLAVGKLAPPPPPPGRLLRAAEQEIRAACRGVATGKAFGCTQEEFIAAYDDCFFRATAGEKIVVFKPGPHGVLESDDGVVLVVDRQVPPPALVSHLAGARRDAPCDTCGVPEVTKKCNGCALARYCSPACQRADWTKHKATCKLIQKK
jgi:hypothetical protein